MKMYYSKSTNGFYIDLIHDSIPLDKVEITQEYHSQLLEGQSSDKLIIGDDSGYPILIDRPKPLLENQLVLLQSITQDYIDSIAKAKGYDNIDRAISYLNSSNDEWKNDANELLLFRDNVWNSCFKIIDDIKNNIILVPSSKEFINMLPKLT